jgi:hypothetical protein
MTDDIVPYVESAVLVLSVAFAAAAAVSGVYIWYVYRQRHEDALFLDRLFRRDMRVSIAGIVILVDLAAIMLNLDPGRPWNSVIIGTAVIAMLYGPTSDAILWFRERRRAEPRKLADRLDQMDARMDSQDTVTVTEMERTDRHQEVQDDRIETVEDAQG